MGQDTFVWDDDLVMQFILAEAEGANKNDRWPDRIEHFKKSHTPKEEKKDWEIVEYNYAGNIFIRNGGYFHCNKMATSMTEGQLKELNCLIHSVKRLSDGEVFTVGDVIKFHSGVNDGEIERFEVDAFDNNSITAYRKYAGVGFNSWQKLPPQPEKKPMHPEAKVVTDRESLPENMRPLFDLLNTRMYTQKELEEALSKCFNACRRTVDTPHGIVHEYNTLEDYLKTIEK